MSTCLSSRPHECALDFVTRSRKLELRVLPASPPQASRSKSPLAKRQWVTLIQRVVDPEKALIWFLGFQELKMLKTFGFSLEAPWVSLPSWLAVARTSL